ncbi:response regulator [Candidatus Magnetomonas plexicatena]|uniref:response regulator n=1 Tax=Candidatus Magnetomonas plexicatena TaxID=2552947 RepID=UPI001C7814DF|nr:response regulator [Nitrospirales bacterium LBB_01]
MYKVLLIEDDDTARKQLAKFVQKERFEVVQAENGRVGIELFESEHPHIVLTDLKMPDIDGMEVVHTVKRLSPETEIIVFTGYGEVDTAIAAIREGVLDYLKKPIDLDALSMALGRASEKISMRHSEQLYPHILLAEDEETPRIRLKRILEKENWRVFDVSNGEEALSTFISTKMDIVLLDIKMPKLDGLEALHQMRAINDDFEAIIFTGYGDEHSAINAMRCGAVSFLRKPVDLDQLIATIEKALEKLYRDRALRYRTRELELAKQILAHITDEEEVILNIHKNVVEQSLTFAQKLMDSIPTPVIVINKDLTIIYMNKSMLEALDFTPKRIDEKLLENLKNLGIKDLSIEQITNAIDILFLEPGKLEILKTGAHSLITLTLITVVGDVKEHYVLMAMRGERSA